jgi:hypothetical protein
MSVSVRRLLGIVRAGCALGVAGAAALSAPAAHAGLINLSECTTSALGRPLAPWGDWSDYELAPGVQPTPVMITAGAVWGALSGGTAEVPLRAYCPDWKPAGR